MVQKEEKGSAESKPRWVWDPEKLAWVETAAPESEEAAIKASTPSEEEKPEVLPAEPVSEEVLEQVSVGRTPVWGAVEAGEVQYKGMWARLGAFLVDAIIILLIEYLLTLIFGEAILVEGNEAGLTEVGGVPTWATFTVVFVYFVGFWLWRGQTPGKMLLGAKIVKADGSHPGILRFLLRYAVYFAYLYLWIFAGRSLLVLGIIVIVAFIIVAFNKKKRGLHDLIAGTVVINTRARRLPQYMDAESSDIPEAPETPEPSDTSEPEADKTETNNQS